MNNIYSKTSINYLTILRVVFIFLCLVLLIPAIWAKNVPQSDAQQIAETFYRLNNPSGMQNPQVRSVTVKSWENIPSFYIFRFTSGGFVLVAADNASIPILAYSFENDMPEVIENPATAEWLDNYSREIGYIISNNLDNSETILAWRSIQEGIPLQQTDDVLPLLTTVWDQGCYYDELCPVDAAGPCGHAVTGCVATAMAQIMKYHNFPPQGVGEHSYTDPNYGEQTVNFGNTNYDWFSMPDSAGSSNSAVATLMYHAGVSVNMSYSATGSGAFDYNVPVSLLNYFNYSPDITLIYKPNYPNVEDFKNLLRADLDAHLPVCYGGTNSTGTSGHEFVCDGYTMSDGTFHFNWGWSGYANGYYEIGYLNPGGTDWNNNNSVVVHIKPYNPDLIVRITNPADKSVASVGDNVEIKAKVVRGNPDLMKIFIDDVEISTSTTDSISFTWNITSNDLGSHFIKAYAYNATDTVYYKELLNISEWVTQASGFTSGSKPIYYLSAIDSNVVWGSTQITSDFTRTINGGMTWTSGMISNSAGAGASMIFGLDSLKAYAATYGYNQGIFMTSDGGNSWARQASASFNNPASYPDIVHFFDENEGIAMGDPVNNEYEIYTTNDGGTNWTLLPGANIPDPLATEWGIIGYYSAVHDTIWFGTSEGRVYKSVNKGLNWSVSSAPGMSGKNVKPTFRNGSHGLLLDGLWGTGLLCETFDGGETWTQINYSGASYHGDIAFVPGTTNTWVRSGYDSGNSGSAYSFDGGHTWTDFIGTNGTPYYPMAWVNNHCGWAGGINSSATEGGIYKYIGILQLSMPPPENVEATVAYFDVELNWEVPPFDPTQMTLLGYNISRNGTKINTSLITGLTYTDLNVPNGQYNYCVTALYNIGESEGSCLPVDITVGISTPGDQPLLMVYPNPADNRIIVKTSSPLADISILDQTGKTIPVILANLQSGLYDIDISSLSPGFYLVMVKSADGISRTKLIVN
jgi:photosystem II stability/assembly factor-like uncharacterized protein